MPTDRFWSYVPDDGFERHGTEAEAQARAHAALDDAREVASDDGWPDFVEGICWGEVREAVVETERRDKAAELAECTTDDEREDVKSEFGQWDEIVNYALEVPRAD